MVDNQASLLAEQTLGRLRNSIRIKGALPGLASAARLIEIAESTDCRNDDDIVKAVLGDPSLLQKVLRLANSAMYASFGGYVDTVSRALAILGTNTVAHLAFSQKLLNNLHPVGESSKSALKMDAAILAGHIGRQFAKDLKSREIETVVICSLMQSMGRLLLEFYLPEDYRRIDQEMALTGEAENDAALRLLGLPVDSLGLEVAREWRMPQTILDGLRCVTPEGDGPALTMPERTAALSTLSHLCAVTMAQNVGATAAARLLALTSTYSGALGVSAEALLLDLDEAVKQARTARAQAGDYRPLVVPSLQAQDPLRKADFLSEGIAGLCLRRDTLTPGQAVWASSEYLFKNLKLNRALVAVRSGTGYEVRASLGNVAQTLLPTLRFGDSECGSLIHMALRKSLVTYVEETQAYSPKTHLPTAWATRLVGTGTVLLLPLVVRGRSLGFIYCDWKQDDPNSILTASDLRAIDNLRNALVAVLSGGQVTHPSPRQTRPHQVMPDESCVSPTLKEKQSHKGSAEE